MKPLAIPVGLGTALAILLAVISESRGEIVPDFQDRIVQVEAGVSDLHFDPGFANSGQWVTQRLGGSDYGLFDETQEASVVLGASSAHGSSHQWSIVEPQSIFARGELEAVASTGTEPGWGGGGAFARNVFDLYFTVDSTAIYTLTTTLNHSVGGEILYNVEASRILFERQDLAEPILQRRVVNDPGGTSAMQVTLESGYRYHLLAEIALDGILSPDNDNGASFSHTADYEILLVPEPGPLTLGTPVALVLLVFFARQKVARRRSATTA